MSIIFQVVRNFFSNVATEEFFVRVFKWKSIDWADVLKLELFISSTIVFFITIDTETFIRFLSLY